MLLGFIISVIFIWILKSTESSLIKKIKNASTEGEIKYLRSKLIKERKLSLILLVVICLLLYIVQVPLYDFEWYNLDLIKGSVFTFAFSQFFIRRRKDHNPFGNLSDLVLSDVMNNLDNYILYLRSFTVDNYETIEKVANKKYVKGTFSEYLFTKSIEKYIKTLAVGMTKEIESPIGAKRIYLTDNSWQSGVATLLDNSIGVCILVDDSSSCIWEINKSHKYLHKTVFIVTDISKYYRAKKDVKFFRFLSGQLKTPFLLWMNNEGYWQTKEFDYEKSSYSDIAKYILKDIWNRSVDIPLRNRLWYKVLVFCFLFGIFNIISSIIYAHLGGDVFFVIIMILLAILLIMLGDVILRKKENTSKIK